MVSEYAFVALLLVVGLIFPVGALFSSFIFEKLRIRPKRPDPIKTSTYECGFDTVGSSWIQFNFRYYSYALLFVVFDIETIFLYPWAVYYQQLALFGLIEMLVFIGILAIGLVYAWKKGALEWV